jgi:hypothetical protein
VRFSYTSFIVISLFISHNTFAKLVARMLAFHTLRHFAAFRLALFWSGLGFETESLKIRSKIIMCALHCLQDMLVIRQLKPIGTFSEKQAKKYLKRGLLFLIPFAFLWLSSIHLLPFYIDLGIFNGNRELLKGVLLTFGMLFILLPYRTWKSGLTGERNVFRNVSNKLSSDYSIFNDVLLKDGRRGGNIDHIIIGPTGIFVIETKNNRGTVTYDGYWEGIKGNPSQQAISNALRIKNVLEDCEVFREKRPYVNAVVLFTNSKINLEKSMDPQWCKVIQIKELGDSRFADYIRNEHVRFSDKEVMSIEQSLKTKIGNYDE